MTGKGYEREIELYSFLGELEKNTNQDFVDFVHKLKESLWQVLHVATTPPGSEQEEFVRPSALADLEKGNTFDYCVSELEKFVLEHPLLGSSLHIPERIINIKALS